jgi:RNA polymerase sigma-70 factor (ECF subfamily)
MVPRTKAENVFTNVSRKRQERAGSLSDVHAAPRTEKELVAQAKHGDVDAFQELIGRSRHGCLRVATGILRNRDDAEDEVQNAFWKAYNHLALFGGQSTFSTWVTRIVINHCLMRYRRARRVQFISYDSLSSDGDWYVTYEPTSKESPEEGVGDREVREALHIELRRLPILLRIPIEMYFIHGRTLDEVAGDLGISVAATKSRLHRGQEYLRDRMLRHCGQRGLATLIGVN